MQAVWSLPGHSRRANKDHSPRCHRRPNGPGRLADKVVQPTTQSYVYNCTYIRVTCKFGFGAASRLTCRSVNNFLQAFTRQHVPRAADRPVIGTIVVPAVWHVDRCHTGPDRTSRSDAVFPLLILLFTQSALYCIVLYYCTHHRRHIRTVLRQVEPHHYLRGHQDRNKLSHADHYASPV